MKRDGQVLSIIALAALLVFTACSGQAEAYRLEYNYTKGDRFVYEMEMTADMEINEGGDRRMGNTQYTMVMIREVLDVDGRGVYDIKSTMDQFKMAVEMDGEKVVIPNMFDDLSFNVKMDRYGKTYSVEGLDMGMFGGMEMQSSVDFSEIIKNSYPPVPQKPVRIGDTWENTIEFSVPGTRDTIKAVSVTRLEGIEEMKGQRVAKIVSTAEIPMDITYNVNDMLEGARQPLSMAEGGGIPGITMELDGYEKVRTISYMTLEEGITLLTEGKVEIEIETATYVGGIEQNRVSTKMSSDVRLGMR